MLMIAGLASTLPSTLSAGPQTHGVGPATAHAVADLPPISIAFAIVACLVAAAASFLRGRPEAGGDAATVLSAAVATGRMSES